MTAATSNKTTRIRLTSQIPNNKMRKSLLVLLLLLMLSSKSLQQQEQQQSLPLHVKIKTLLTNLQSYFFPPNLDFRGSVRKDEPTVTGGEKVKEAVAKSIGEGKATVEETARTAAQKLKDTFSSHDEPQEDL